MILTAASSFVFAAGVKVAVVKSWGDGIPAFTELNNNYGNYGSIPLTIDTSLRLVSSFTYEDLVSTDANVLWLSNPAGGVKHYSDAEVAAIEQYVSEGHSILGTYRVFQGWQTDNRKLAPIFGLPQDVNYNTDIVGAGQTFDIIDTYTNHPLFTDINDPYISNGYANAQVPDDDYSWDANDLKSAQLLAKTDDNRGIITLYETTSYHAIFISEMPEYNDSPADMQLLYNALTVPEPATICLLAIGSLTLTGKNNKKSIERKRL